MIQKWSDTEGNSRRSWKCAYSCCKLCDPVFVDLVSRILLKSYCIAELLGRLHRAPAWFRRAAAREWQSAFASICGCCETNQRTANRVLAGGVGGGIQKVRRYRVNCRQTSRNVVGNSHALSRLQARSGYLWKNQIFCFWVLTFRAAASILAKLFGCHSAGQGGRSSLTIDTMCQNPFETIRPYSSPNG